MTTRRRNEIINRCLATMIVVVRINPHYIFTQFVSFVIHYFVFVFDDVLAVSIIMMMMQCHSDSSPHEHNAYDTKIEVRMVCSHDHSTNHVTLKKFLFCSVIYKKYETSLILHGYCVKSVKVSTNLLPWSRRKVWL
jgi:hypothetical protein